MKPRKVILRIKSTNDIPVKELEKKVWLQLQYLKRPTPKNDRSEWIVLKIDHVSAQVVKTEK